MDEALWFPEDVYQLARALALLRAGRASCTDPLLQAVCSLDHNLQQCVLQKLLPRPFAVTVTTLTGKRIRIRCHNWLWMIQCVQLTLERSEGIPTNRQLLTLEVPADRPLSDDVWEANRKLFEDRLGMGQFVRFHETAQYIVLDPNEPLLAYRHHGIAGALCGSC
eukprot:TRINITY_DN18564_c0_g1_i1.p1 TRINITY_DN18564_c0_g1~~TRINITY_DN18564_c0_g1_i1.p1  ORF type:complete len:165 (-),score=15.08 TRINITY_DN18564_c0_g1_i1:372-866(-)